MRIRFVTSSAEFADVLLALSGDRLESSFTAAHSPAEVTGDKWLLRREGAI